MCLCVVSAYIFFCLCNVVFNDYCEINSAADQLFISFLRLKQGCKSIICFVVSVSVFVYVFVCVFVSIYVCILLIKGY